MNLIPLCKQHNRDLDTLKFTFGYGIDNKLHIIFDQNPDFWKICCNGVANDKKISKNLSDSVQEGINNRLRNIQSDISHRAVAFHCFKYCKKCGYDIKTSEEKYNAWINLSLQQSPRNKTYSDGDSLSIGEKTL